MSELTKEKYTITKGTLELVLEALGGNWFSSCGNYNNDDVIESERLLRMEINNQQGVNK